MNPGIEFSLGIDLAQESFEVAIAPEGIAASCWRELANTHLPWAPPSPEGIDALVRWIGEQCPQGKCLRVVVESTGQLSKRFARALRGRGLPEVCIINPFRSKAFGQSLGVKDKTDRIDCAILALYGAVQKLQPVLAGSEAEEKLRELTRLRGNYVGEVRGWENRLREANEPVTKKCLEKTIKHLKKQIQELDEAIEALVLSDAKLHFQVKSLKQIRCIKQVAATTLTAELGDLTTYGRNQIVARAGLFARRFESGRSVYRPPRLVKGGCQRVRSVLYMCATSSLSSKGELRAYAERLRKRGLQEMEILMAIMRKLLLICRAVMINGGVYDEAKIGRQVRS